MIVVRESKFRQIIVESPGPSANFTELSASDVSTHGEILSANHHFIAYVNSSNNEVNVLDAKGGGKRGPEVKLTTLKAPNAGAHTCAPLTDVAVSFIQPGLIAAGGSSSSAVIWRVPPGGGGYKTMDPTQVLVGEHTRAVQQVKWHPTASEALLTAASSTCRVWDVENNKAKMAFDCQASNIWTCAWNPIGSRIAVSSEDKSIRVLDPRDREVSHVKEAHTGPKAIVLEWATVDTFFSTGFSAAKERELCLWDVRFLEEPVKKLRVDTTSGTLRPMYDADTQLLYVSGHGDVNIRVYEMDFASEEPFMPIGNFPAKISTEGSKSVCLMPKPALDVMECEIARIYRLMKTTIEAVRVEVPRRKAYRDFQADLFPDTRAPTPAMTQLDYFKGENAPPILATVQSLTAKHSTADATVKRAGDAEQVIAEEISRKEEEDRVENDRLAHHHADLDKRFSKFLGYQAKMKFTKVIQANKNQQCYFNLIPEVGGADPVVAVNEHFFAVPWKTGGSGAIYVGSLNKPGKVDVPQDVPTLNGHGASVNSIAFAEFDPLQLATGSDDCGVRVWKLKSSSGITSSQDATDALSSSMKMEGGHRLSVRGVVYNRVARGVLGSFSMDSTIKIWDVDTGQNKIDITLPETTSASNIDWGYGGNDLAVSGRDSDGRIYDVRGGNTSGMKPIYEWKAHEGLKGMKIAFLGNSGGIITTGFGKTGDREFKLWDIRASLDKPLNVTKLDAGAGIMIPYYVEDNGVLILQAKGELTVRIYEIEGLSLGHEREEPGKAKHEVNKFAVHACTEWRATGDPSAGLAFMARRHCDPYQAEWLKGIRLTPNSVEMLSFTVPRSADISSFFFDDIFPPTKSFEPTITSPDEWFNGKGPVTPKRMDLNIKKAIPLSERPIEQAQASIKKAIANTDRMRKEQEEQEQKRKEKAAALERMEKLAKQHETYNPNLSKSGAGHDDHHAVETGPADVKDEEWGD
jgi:WD40 repeat protein